MSIANLLVKLDILLFKNKVMENIFLLILLGRYLLQIFSTSINILLLSCKVSWVFILVYYILAIYILIWYLRSLLKNIFMPLCKNLYYSFKGYYSFVYYISQLNTPVNGAYKPIVTSIYLA